MNVTFEKEALILCEFLRMPCVDILILLRSVILSDGGQRECYDIVLM